MARKIAKKARFVSTDGFESITYEVLLEMSSAADKDLLTATFTWSRDGHSVDVQWGYADGSWTTYVYTNEK